MNKNSRKSLYGNFFKFILYSSLENVLLVWYWEKTYREYLIDWVPHASSTIFLAKINDIFFIKKIIILKMFYECTFNYGTKRVDLFLGIVFFIFFVGVTFACKK